jgi:hypothetical protein
VGERERSTTMVGVGGPRIVVIPRWGGTASDDWYPWLRRELAGISMHVLELPDPQAPTIESWTYGILEALGDDPYALAQTLLVGHSVGAQAALRATAMLAPGRAVANLLAVAGWLSIDEPWPEIQPWIDTPIDADEVAEGAHRIRVLISTNDPYTADHGANADAWRERFEAETVIVDDAAHFNAAQEPIVLHHVRELFAKM